jgi:hypothetical protein
MENFLVLDAIIEYGWKKRNSDISLAAFTLWAYFGTYFEVFLGIDKTNGIG